MPAKLAHSTSYTFNPTATNGTDSDTIILSLHSFSSILYVNQVCCSGFLYTKKPRHECCEGSYLGSSNSSNPVCCNGKLLPASPDHHCCGGNYIHVKTSECHITSYVYTCLRFALFCLNWVKSFLCRSSVPFICPWLCRRKVLPWPRAGPGLSRAGWQMLWGGSLLHERRPALL